MATASSAADRRVLEHSRSEQKTPSISESTLGNFCQELSPDNSRAVVNTVSEISRLRQGMIINMLAIGERLSKLRAALGVEKFAQFMREILPAFGISRSTGYRWLGFAEKLSVIFPNRLIRQQLMALTDGKGIVTNPGKNSSNFGKLILTPAAEAALRILPPAPVGHEGHVESELWVRQFIAATAKARAQSRVPGRNRTKEQEAIVRRFSRFAASYGSTAAEDLCGQLDKVLNRIVESGAHFKPGRLALLD